MCRLPLDCLDKDADGKYVLIYTDYKENRLQRRLPIPDSAATLIRGQQAAVRAAPPHTNPSDLALLPKTSGKPDGSKPLRAVDHARTHRPVERRTCDAVIPTAGRSPEHWDDETHTWAIEPGLFTVCAGRSSAGPAPERGTDLSLTNLKFLARVRHGNPG